MSAPQTIIKFGTDGWRAVMAEDFTFANLERVAQAYASYLRREAKGDDGGGGDGGVPLIVIGYDRRFLSERFARRVAEVLRGNELRVLLFDRAVPTPLVSWGVKELGAAGGVVITASHNPPEFNGFKIKAPWGGSASVEITAQVEKLIDAEPARRAPLDSSDQEVLAQSERNYRAQLASFIDLEKVKSVAGRVVVDSMHGTGGRWVEETLAGGRLEVETIRGERDALFGGVNPEPIDSNLGPLKLRVKEAGAMLGLATDGDADRVGAVNELGETMTMHEVVPLVVLHLAERRNLAGGVVRTFSQSVLTKRIAQDFNLPLHDTPIGFKYIADLMLREDILIGAEESGGIGVKGHIPERDGILNSLLLLEAVAEGGRPVSELVRRMHERYGEFYFGRRDVHLEVARGQALVAQLGADPPASYADYRVTGVETLDGTKLLFDDESWLLFRQSGTEPVLRLYSEATSKDKMRQLLGAANDLVTKTIGR